MAGQDRVAGVLMQCIMVAVSESLLGESHER